MDRRGLTLGGRPHRRGDEIKKRRSMTMTTWIGEGRRISETQSEINGCRNGGHGGTSCSSNSRLHDRPLTDGKPLVLVWCRQTSSNTQQ